MIDPVTEQALADLSDDQWRVLVSRVRPPADPKTRAAEALRAHQQGMSREVVQAITNALNRPAAGTAAAAADAAPKVAGQSGHPAAANALRDYQAGRRIDATNPAKSDPGSAIGALRAAGWNATHDPAGDAGADN